MASQSHHPPGLQNLQNTCFFNSTLQALLAISLIETVVRPDKVSLSPPIPTSDGIFDPYRSPAVNAWKPKSHNGLFSRDSMPVCIDFFCFMEVCYSERDAGPSGSLNPKPLLMCLGKIYPQYLDFRQQDAHELLRQLLDAMEMEELDAIRRLKKAKPEAAEKEWVPFVTMLFGGQLASLLMCEGCRHVGVAQEPFMDLSLPIHVNEKHRKRDILRQFVRRMKKEPFNELPPPTPMSPRLSPAMPLLAPRPLLPGTPTVETPRSQSVPPQTPIEIQVMVENLKSDAKGRSTESLVPDSDENDKTSPLPSPLPSPGEVSASSVSVSMSQEGGLKRALSRTSVDAKALWTRGRNAARLSAGNLNYSAASSQATTPAQSRDPSPKVRSEKERVAEGLLSSKLGHQHLFNVTLNATHAAHMPETGVVEGLRDFTSVETLEGENAFACKRCWKRRNRLRLPPRKNTAKSLTDSSDSDERDESKSKGKLTANTSSPKVPSIKLTAPTSLPDKELSDPRSIPPSPKSRSSGVNVDVLPPKEDRVVRQRALKRYLISAPPPVLVVHLKRFQQITRSSMAIFGTLRKVEDYVSFPERLDLRDFIFVDTDLKGKSKNRQLETSGRGCLYRLCAVVVHVGSMLGGHYVAYTASPTKKIAKSQVERTWWFISDTIVRSAALEEVLTAKAYMCYYERMQ